MKRLVLFALISIIIVSCDSKGEYPLSGRYEVQTEDSKDTIDADGYSLTHFEDYINFYVKDGYFDKYTTAIYPSRKIKVIKRINR